MFNPHCRHTTNDTTPPLREQQGIPVSAIGTNLRGGARCMFLATNTLPSDQCGGFNALLFFLLAIPGGLAFNLCLGYGVALGSASYLWLV